MADPSQVVPTGSESSANNNSQNGNVDDLSRNMGKMSMDSGRGGPRDMGPRDNRDNYSNFGGGRGNYNDRRGGGYNDNRNRGYNDNRGGGYRNDNRGYNNSRAPPRQTSSRWDNLDDGGYGGGRNDNYGRNDRGYGGG